MSEEQPKYTNTIKKFLAKIPLITKVLVLITIVSSIFGFFSILKTNNFCQSPRLFLMATKHLYRLITWPFFHTGILYLILTVVSLIPIMSGIEKILGSVNLVVLLIFTISMITISNFFIAYGVYKIFGSTSSYYNCNDGQAPIIFALSVINCKLDQLNLTRSIFGLVNVPKLAFPFILYICFIIVTPMGTFTFLTSGMLYGYCFVFARLEFLFFSVKNLERIESKLCCIIKSKNFITHQNALFYKGETILPDFLSQKSLNSDSDKNSLIEGDFIPTVQDADSLLNGFQELDENEQWK